MKICVIGLGYVGLPTALLLAKAGHDVVGVDVNDEKLKEIDNGRSHLREEGVDEILSEVKNSGKFRAKNKPEESDVFIVCVPTPLKKSEKKAELKYVVKSTESIVPFLKRGNLVLLESTVPPGTTEEIMLPILEKSGLDVNKELYIAHSPERVLPGNLLNELIKNNRIVGGLNEISSEKAKEVYKSFVEGEIYITNVKTAEAVKVMENTFRFVNIGLANEFSELFAELGIDVWEAIELANKHPRVNIHFPGPGVGGHCFDKNTKIFLINNNHHKIKNIGPYINSLKCEKQVINDSEIFYPEKVKVLSFDPIKRKTLFKPVTIASKRKSKDLLRIICPYNYELKVTDLHPVIIYDNGLKIKIAKDLNPGDKLVLNKLLPDEKESLKIDVIEHLNQELYGKMRIKPKKEEFSKFKKVLDKNLKGNIKDYYRWNFLPLEKFLKVEKLLGLKREDIFLCTGKGPSFKKFPAVLNIDGDFLRLIGYYLSEGCITEDKSLRTRFTFNKNEVEYIRDLKNILDKYKLDYSVYEDKNFDSYCIKISSNIFGLLLKDILKCGTNCYNMQIPEMFFNLKKTLKEEMLKGIFRGDGGVSWHNGKRKYLKNNKIFKHNNNCIEISYFTSSHILFQQVILFLLNQGVIPKMTKRVGYLKILGPIDAKKVKAWFLGEKRRKIENYLKNLNKKINYNKIQIYKDFITLSIGKIERTKTDYVYSVEVEGTNTLIISNGIIAHNCIPIDPWFLHEKNSEKAKFIALAGEINEKVQERIIDYIHKLVPENGKVAVLGVSYKENVGDTRESPASKLISKLIEHGIEVSAHDPFVEKFHYPLSSLEDALKDADCVVILNKHKPYLELGPENFKEMRKKNIFDCRNIWDEEKFKNSDITLVKLGKDL